jgi:inner membrane protein
MKVFGIAFLILVLLVPIAMTRGVISDRVSVATAARQDIMRSWGQPQVVGGPILVIPYRIERKNYYEDRREETGNIYLLPEELSVDAVLLPEIRYRGLHKVPVYTAHTTMNGVFAAPILTGLGIDDAVIDMRRAYFALSITDAKAVRNAPTISINGQSSAFEAGGSQIPGFHPQIVAQAGEILAAAERSPGFTFSIDLDLSGTDKLQYLPLANASSVSMRSAWQSPSFIGGYLPESREIREDGFAADWRISSLGRELPARWTSDSYSYIQTPHSSFGVGLFVPVGMYQLIDRATKYAILFIGLTFVGYFLFEVISGLHLHPLQYLLVGFANTLFYLLLLSFAEHIGFGWAYLVSAVASTGLIAGYSSSILYRRGRATLIVLMLICLYGFLYLILRAENFALLAGSLGLWVSLGIVMYLTRRIDWHRWGRRDDDNSKLQEMSGD